MELLFEFKEKEIDKFLRIVNHFIFCNMLLKQWKIRLHAIHIFINLYHQNLDNIFEILNRIVQTISIYLYYILIVLILKNFN